VGERVRVRGYLADILYITPHLYPLPSRGEEHKRDFFPDNLWLCTNNKKSCCWLAGQSIGHQLGYDRVIKRGGYRGPISLFPSKTTKKIMARMSNVKT
jgi:hypothetical protein